MNDSSKNITQYQEFLETATSDITKIKGLKETHSILTGGKFYIKPGSIDAFNKAYSYCRFVGEEDYYFAEKPKGIGPLRLDFDLKKSQNEDQRIVTDEYLTLVCKAISGIIRNNFDVKTEKMYVMVRSVHGKEKEYIKDGIHIVVPEIAIDFDSFTIVRNELLKIDELYQGMLNTPDLIVDKSAFTVCWLMYGCKKDYGAHWYPLKWVYDITTDTYIDSSSKDFPTDLTLPNTLSILNKDKFYQKAYELRELESKSKVKAKTKSKSKGIFDDSDSESDMGSEDDEEALLKLQLERYQSKKDKINDELDNEEIRMIEETLDRLPEKFYTEYDSWCEVGLTLSGGSKHDARVKVLWHKFSKKDKIKYDKKKADEIRKNGDPNRTCIRHLYNMAREVLTPQEFEKILAHSVANKIYYMIYNHRDSSLEMASLVAEMIRDKYVTDTVGPNDLRLYVFNGVVWVLSPSPKITALNIILDKLLDAINKAGEIIIKKLSKRTSKGGTDILSDYCRLRNKIKDQGAKQIINYLLESQCLGNGEGGLLRADFAKGLDLLDKAHLIAFKNGVYDLNEAKFRPGNPDDMLSVCVPIDYVEYNPENPKSKKFMEIFESWLPDQEIRDYMFIQLASALKANVDGINFAIICKGGGKNGKSKFFDLIRKGFGMDESGYGQVLPIEALTTGHGKSSFGSAQPDLAALNKKRMVLTDEPEKGCEFNTSLFKRLTGGDILKVRDLYRTSFSLSSTFRLFIALNNMIKFTNIDKSMQRRFQIVMFESVFVDKPDPKKPYQKKKLSNINKILTDITPIFMSYLVKIYVEKIRGNEDIIDKTPAKVEMERDRIIEAFNPLQKYIKARLELTDNNEYKIPFEKLIPSIKLWAKANNLNDLVDLDQSTMTDYLFNELSDYITEDKKMLKCYRFKTEDKSEDKEPDAL